jgi:hypothetical protein
VTEITLRNPRKPDLAPVTVAALADSESLHLCQTRSRESREIQPRKSLAHLLHGSGAVAWREPVGWRSKSGLPEVMGGGGVWLVPPSLLKSGRRYDRPALRRK